MRNELKIEFNQTEVLTEFLDSCYFTEECFGKVNGKHSLLVEDETTKVILKGLNAIPIRITNEKIDGTLKCTVIEEDNNVFIRPISVYCIKERRYNFW